MRTSILLILFSISAFSQESLRIHSLDETITRLKGAVLKVEIYENKKIVEVGTAFFIDKKGTFLTNYHVLSSVIEKKKNHVVRILTKDGKSLTNISLGKCIKNQKKADLCIGKVKSFIPKAWFDIGKKRLSIGHNIVNIGHCSKGDYLSGKGKTIAYHDNFVGGLGGSAKDWDYGVKQIEHNALGCKGSSGGPLFDNKGLLLGITTAVYENEGKLHSLGISSQEISSYINQKHEFKKLSSKFTYKDRSKNPLQTF